MADSVVIWGAGGHGRVLRDIAAACGELVLGFISQQALDLVEDLPVLAERDVTDGLASGLPLGAGGLVLGIGENHARWRVFGLAPESRWRGLVHPMAVVSNGAKLGPGTVVMPGAVINAGTRVGAACIINTGAIVEHDCRIADGVHVSPGATLCGDVHAGHLAWIGAGATILPGVTIGEGAIVGAGATVIRDVPARATVAGTPAQPLPSQKSI